MRRPFDETARSIIDPVDISDLEWSDYADTVPVPALQGRMRSLYGEMAAPSPWPARTARIASVCTLLALGWGLSWVETVIVSIATFVLVVMHAPRPS